MSNTIKLTKEQVEEMYDGELQDFMYQEVVEGEYMDGYSLYTYEDVQDVIDDLYDELLQVFCDVNDIELIGN